ncbi:MAG: O-antigen ligase family protein, partial [Phycisphaeraceae bacterium]
MLLVTVFVIASLLSTASALPGVVVMKYARVYVTLLAVAVALVCVRPWQIGPASRALLAFSLFYVLAALWSEDPIGGVMFKGLFLLTVMLGMAGVLAARDEEALWKWQRCVVVAAGVLTLILLAGVARQPGLLLGGARLSLFGLNPNRIAETLGPLVVFCCFGVLYEHSKLWRTMAYAIGLSAAALLLATGSRGGFGQAMLGFMLLMLPLVRRPGVFAAVCIVVGVSVLLVLGVVEESRAVRFAEYDFTTRGQPWTGALARFRESPLIGIGWARMSTGEGWGSSVNMHSIYFQVLVEMGIVGALALAACLAWLGRCAWHAFRATAQEPTLRPMCLFAATLGATALAHGVIESGAIMGSSLNAMCFGASAALLDWLTIEARHRAAYPVETPTPLPA